MRISSIAVSKLLCDIALGEVSSDSVKLLQQFFQDVHDLANVVRSSKDSIKTEDVSDHKEGDKASTVRDHKEG